MTSTTPTPRQKPVKQKIPLVQLIKQHKIHFHQISDRLPASLQREGAAVQAITSATNEEIWDRSSQITKKRVGKIYEAVRWCLKNENNEDKWRYEVGTKIINPLTQRHSCPQCGKRLWQADFEFPISDEQGERWENLRRRRYRREKCACKSRIVMDGQIKDRVFESLPGSTVRYDPGLRDRIAKGIRPDLVVGLFNGPKLTTLLDAPSRSDPTKRVGDLVKADIFVQDDSVMIFPFLVLEAKRARARDSLEDMERQMAFPVYEMLRAQNRLLGKSTVLGRNDRLPRVWLVSFKAQVWRLYVATMGKDDDGDATYNIYNVWSGDVSGKWDALKLVLLMDCIFDWALDIYRLDIFESLQSMVAPNPRIPPSRMAPSVSDLSESLGGLGISDTIDPRIGTLDTIYEDTQEDVLKFKHAWIRDGRRVLISGEGLTITQTNIADVFDNFEHPDHAKRFARMIWALFSKEAWQFPSELILDKVREVWTGEKEHRQQSPDVPIYVQLEVYAYFNTDWQPTRKLIFLAVTKDSIPELFRRTRYPKQRSDEIDMVRHRIPEEKFLAKLRDGRKPRDGGSNITEAVKRWHCWLGSTPKHNLQWAPVSVPSCDKAFQEILRMYQVGRKEPSESFLKIWHGSQSTILAKAHENCLVFGETDERDWQHIGPRNRAPRLCLFVFRDLNNLNTANIAHFLTRHEKQGFKNVHYHYTVLRGKYFTGSTHFDDNRPGSEPWWFEGLISPEERRPPVFPSLALLLGESARDLRNGESDYSDTGSEGDGYRTDDSDHRGDCGNSGSESNPLTEDEGEKEVDSGEDQTTGSESDVDYVEASEYSDTGSEGDGYRTDDSDHRGDCGNSGSESNPLTEDEGEKEVDSGEDQTTGSESDVDYMEAEPSWKELGQNYRVR